MHKALRDLILADRQGYGLRVTHSCLELFSKGLRAKCRPVNILVLHSYHQGYKWADDISRGLSDILFSGLIPIALHVEYMDTKRVTADDYYENLPAFDRKKIP